MRELTYTEIDAELAEQLPARELLCASSGSTYSHNQVAIGNGNTNQQGLINVSALNGNLSGNHVFVL